MLFPVVGTLWSRVGGVAAHPENAYRLLRDQQQLVLVFPEGGKGPGKTYAERYQLRRFGRGGFVEIAMRAGVPIIPIAVLGAEESMPTVAKLPAISSLLNLPYLPITDYRQELLQPSDTVTHCPYKGSAGYWSVVIGDKVYPDLVWIYRTPLPESQKVAGLAAVYNEKVDIYLDGVLQDRPKTGFA